MSNWLSKHLGVRFDGHTLGNLVKNASPALAFTPLGALGVAGASALGDLGRGKRDVGGILKGALTNATIGTGLKAGSGLLHHALTPGTAGTASTATTSTAAGVAPPQLSIPTGSLVQNTGAGTIGVPGQAGAAFSAPAAGLTASAPSSPSFLSKSLNFVKENPNAASLGLSAVGNLATSGAENRASDANTRLLNQRYQETEDDRRRRKELDAYLNTLRAA